MPSRINGQLCVCQRRGHGPGIAVEYIYHRNYQLLIVRNIIHSYIKSTVAHTVLWQLIVRAGRMSAFFSRLFVH